MNREERIRAVLNKQEPDRIPVSVWMHFSAYDQDPRSLAEYMVEYNETYDFDFIKMMPFGAYTTPDWGAKLDIYCDKYKEVEIAAPGIVCPEDYARLEVLAPTHGSWGKTLQVAQYTSKLVKPNTPFLQTIFAPTTTLKKLAGARMVRDMKEHPALVHQALEVITQTTINFIKANIEAGVSGFFYASQCTDYAVMDDMTFAEFGKPYDLRVIAAFQNETWFNVMHVHGINTMFDTALQYPFPVINWHDRQTTPTLKDAREKTDKVFLGGLREGPSIKGSSLHYDSIMARPGITPADIKAHLDEAINMVGGKGLIVGPGCVADPRTPSEILHAVRAAVER